MVEQSFSLHGSQEAKREREKEAGDKIYPSRTHPQ
jgi:hypothetical protein